MKKFSTPLLILFLVIASFYIGLSDSFSGITPVGGGGTPIEGGGGGGGGGISGAGTDDHVMRWDGTGAAQDSLLILDDAGVLSGATQLNLGNLRLDGNTISSENANGDIILNPNAAGQVSFPDLTISQPAYINALGYLVSQDLSLTADVTGVLPLANGGSNKNMTAVAGGFIYSDADSMEVTAAGTAGQPLLSGGAGAPTYFGATGVVKASTGVLSVSNVDLTSEVTGILPVANGGSGLDTSAVTAGQILIGHDVNNNFSLATIAATADETTVTNADGSITIGTVQAINTTSTPTFNGILLVDGTEGASGDVWTSTGIAGEGDWVTPTPGEVNTVSNAGLGATGGTDFFLPVGNTIAFTTTSDTEWGAEAFTASFTGMLREVRLHIARQSAVPTGNMLVGIYAVNPATSVAAGDAEPTGAAIATQAIDISDIPLFGAGPWSAIPLTSIKFSTMPTLTTGTDYAIVLDFSGVTGLNNPRRIEVNGETPDAYANGNQISSGDNGATWTPDATVDLAFAVDIGFLPSEVADLVKPKVGVDIPVRRLFQNGNINLMQNADDVVISAILNADDITGIIPLESGGTNKALVADDGAFLYLDADSIEATAVGTAGQPLLSGGVGAPTFFAGTGVVKAAAGVLSVSNVDLTTEVTGILPVTSGGTGEAGLAILDGGLLIGDNLTGVYIHAQLIEGDPDRVTIVNAAGGSITISGPQDINTTSSPTFAGATFTGAVTMQTFFNLVPITALLRDTNYPAPAIGDVIFNDDLKQPQYYNGTAWISF